MSQRNLKRKREKHKNKKKKKDKNEEIKIQNRVEVKGRKRKKRINKFARQCTGSLISPKHVLTTTSCVTYAM